MAVKSADNESLFQFSSSSSTDEKVDADEFVAAVEGNWHIQR